MRVPKPPARMTTFMAAILSNRRCPSKCQSCGHPHQEIGHARDDGSIKAAARGFDELAPCRGSLTRLPKRPGATRRADARGAIGGAADLACLRSRQLDACQCDGTPLFDDVLTGSHGPAAFGSGVQSKAGQGPWLVVDRLGARDPLPHVPVQAMIEPGREAAQLLIDGAPDDEGRELDPLIDKLALDEILAENAACAGFQVGQSRPLAFRIHVDVPTKRAADLGMSL